MVSHRFRKVVFIHALLNLGRLNCDNTEIAYTCIYCMRFILHSSVLLRRWLTEHGSHVMITAAGIENVSEAVGWCHS